MSIDMTKYPKYLDNKSENKKKDNSKNKINIYENKVNNIKVQQKIDEYIQKEKALYNELKINIKKMQNDINLTNIYRMKRNNYIESYTEANNNINYDDFY